MKDYIRKILVMIGMLAIIISFGSSDSLVVSAASEGWSLPINLSNSVVSFWSSSIATDSKGNIHVVWEQRNTNTGTSGIFYSGWNGSTWSSPVLIDEGNIGPHSIATDRLGNLHIIYFDLNLGLLQYRVFNGSLWSAPVPVSESIHANIQWPSIAINPVDNTPHVVWSNSTADDTIWRIYHAVWNGQAWSEPRDLSGTAYRAYLPQISVDNTGIVHVVWLEFDSRLIYYQDGIGNSWSTPIPLSEPSTPASWPDIVTDSAGNIHVVWSYGRGISYTRGPNWTTPISVFNSAYTANLPSIAVDSEDNLHLVWNSPDGSGNEEILYNKWDGVSWSPNPIKIAPGTRQAVAPDIAIDISGNPHVIWQNHLSSPIGLHVFYSTAAPLVRLKLPLAYQDNNANSNATFNEIIKKCATSVFDHQYPLGTRDESLLPFTGISLRDTTATACKLGINCYDSHEGWDFDDGGICGTEVYPAAEGDIIEAVCTEASKTVDYGCYVVIRHSDTGYETLYGHLDDSTWDDYPRTGHVATAEAIGRIGDTGNSEGSHLHFGVRYKGVFFNEETGQETPYTVVVDPSGWFSPSPDPWEEQKRSERQWAKSLYLWGGQIRSNGRIDGTVGGTIASPSEDVLVSIPAGAYNDRLSFELVEIPIAIGVAISPEGLKSAGHSFSLIARDTSGNEISTFDPPLQITVYFTPEDLEDLNIQTVSFYTWNDDNLQWDKVSNTNVNTNDRTATVALSHLSYFALLGLPNNTSPTVNVGGPYTGDEGALIPLANASASGPDNDQLTINWSIDSLFCTFSDSSILQPTLTCSDNGTFIVTLEVSDGTETVSSQTTVMVSNLAPTVSTISTIPAETVMAVGTAVTFGAAFSDPGTADTHTVIWDWDDGTTSAGTINEANGSGSVSGSHTYATAGIYTVKGSVRDDDGAAGESILLYVVVYDPSAGFVTGGGWINSPAGAYASDPTLTGKANFGFVAKYKKGATTPTGQTEFQFQLANLNFHSTSYDWLVVAGAHAKFKGVGTINGSGNYGFMLTATDGQINGGGGIDKFRIKIWNKNNGDAVVYDNQMNEPDDANAGTTLGSGNIVIHSDSKGSASATSTGGDTIAQPYIVYLPLIEQ